MIELLGWATSRAVARQFLETTNIATWDAENQVMVPRQDIQLHPFRISESIEVVKVPAVMDGTTVVTPPVMAPGFHFNLRIYGDLEETLREADPPENGDYWSKVKLKTYIDNKLGSSGSLANKDVTGAKLPGGYQWSVGPNKVRLYDGALVNSRANVWA
jgi:hypothetical protein